MRLRRGILTELQKVTGIKNNYLSDLVSTRKRPGRNKALVLEKGAKKIGKTVPAGLWLYGSTRQIKKALNGQDNAHG